jgi:hypothetical protein
VRAFITALALLLAGCAQLEYKRPASPVWAYRIDDSVSRPWAIVYWPSERLCEISREGRRAPCRRAMVTDGRDYWAVTLYGRDGEHGWALTTPELCEQVTRTSTWGFRHRTRCAPVSVRFED